MDENWHSGDLSLQVLLGPAPTHYQLVEVGAIRSRQASHLEPEALVYFKAVDDGTRAAPDAKRLLQPIPMQLATLFVPGTVWSANGKLISEGVDTYAERRTLTLGKKAPGLRRLAQLFPSETSRPVVLQETSPDAWYAVIDGDNEKLLIPCFELLRAFYY